MTSKLVSAVQAADAAIAGDISLLRGILATKADVNAMNDACFEVVSFNRLLF